MLTKTASWLLVLLLVHAAPSRGAVGGASSPVKGAQHNASLPRRCAPQGPSVADGGQPHSLPLRFETVGGNDGRRFRAFGLDYAVSVGADRAVLVFVPPHSARRGTRPTDLLALRLVGADANASARALEPLRGLSHYYQGADPASWRCNVPGSRMVRFCDVYPGIDVVYYGTTRQFEYDFIVAPGYSPDRIELEVEAGKGLCVSKAGNLVVRTSSGRTVTQRRPIAYQESALGRTNVAVRYALDGRSRVRIVVGDYDRARPLVVDPLVTFSACLGGRDNDEAVGVAVNEAGSAYVVGTTVSPDFLGGGGPPANPPPGAGATFVAKLTASTNEVEYVSYISGAIGQGIAVDRGGSAVITGVAVSDDFPVTPGALQTASGGGTDAFVTKLTADGSGLVSSSRFGGEADDEGQAVVLDALGDAIIAGRTRSENLPVVSGPQQRFGGGPSDAFVASLNAQGTTLLMSSYLGGRGTDYARDVAVDSASAAYVTGYTDSADFPATPGAFQRSKGSADDVFVSKVDPLSSALVYSTFVGGSGSESGAGVAVDTTGAATICGGTSSPDFPVTPDTVQPNYTGGSGGLLFGDGFVLRLAPGGGSLLYSTFLGGDGGDACFDVALDGAGNAYVAGATTSGDFPVTCEIGVQFGGGFSDAFVAGLDPTAKRLLFSGYVGGNGFDQGLAVGIDPGGVLTIAGTTASQNFPVVSSPRTWSGATDGFVTRIDTSQAGTVCPTPHLDNIAILRKRKIVDALKAGKRTAKYSLNVYGSGFTRSSRVIINGQRVSVYFITSSVLNAKLPAGRIDTVDSWPILVQSVDGQSSNALTIPIQP